MAESYAAELYVTQGTSAADTNGGYPLGVDDGPVYTSANVDAIEGVEFYELTDNSGSDWAGVSVDDYLQFDTAGTKQIAKVTALNYGSDANVITVDTLATAVQFSLSTRRRHM